MNKDNIIDFDKERRKRGYVDTVTLGDVTNCDFYQSASIDIGIYNSDTGEPIFIKGPLYFGDDEQG